MSKKVSSNTHKTTTRERVTQPDSSAWRDPNGRAERRRAEREQRRARAKATARARMAANPRLVRF